MKKNELIRSQGKVYRVLDTSEQRILVIDCMKLTMPQWIEETSITSDAEAITDDELSSITGFKLPDVKELTPEDNAIAHRRFSMISGILPVIADKDKRSTEISRISKQYELSKQSIRNYLCLYLAYQNITALAPKRAIHERSLTSMEKAMRWGLNKFFYTKNKNKSFIKICVHRLYKRSIIKTTNG